MSDPGLYTHLYAQLRDCAELVDRVIIDLETTGGATGTEERKALVTVLRALQAAPASNLSAVLLSNVLRHGRVVHPVNWGNIADAIDRGEASEAVIARLEELARALESERADMHARMHGSHAR
jgi:hypothetical protein